MSQAQEIGQIYRRLKTINNGLDVDNLMWGVDGFYYHNYPNHWNRVFSKMRGIKAPVTTDAEPEFNGDPVYSQKLWTKFKTWAKMNKGIDIKDLR